MKRIALIRNSYSYDVGGAEIFPINLGKILNTGNYIPVVLSSNRKTLALAKAAGLRSEHSPWWSLQDISGVRVLLFPAYLAWASYLTLWYMLYFLKGRIDIAHPQGRDDFVAATLAAKLLGIKIIWTDHADLKHIYANHRIWYKNPVGKLVYLVSHLADQVTIESHSEKKLIENSLGKPLPKNYIVIHIGVVDSCTPEPKEAANLVVVATSRLVKAKGIGELIEAFKQIDDKKAILKLCGDGPDATHFKSLAADTPNIEFLGHVDNVQSVLQQSDIFVHPTYHEGFGLSLVEAEMCELPIVASNVGSIPEIVKDGESGILVPVKDVDGLVEAINTLANNSSLRAKMGHAGREIFLRNFQFDKIVKDKFIPLYEK